MQKKYSIAEARNSLPALVHNVESGPPIQLTRRGRAVAVLLSVADYAKLSRDTPDLWAAVEKYRATTDLDELDVDGILADVRDPSPGRPTEI